MKIQIVDHKDKLLSAVINLGKKHSKTLGLFPEGAFRDHARKKNIYAAVEDEIVLGYILFRITQSKQTLSIAHLCVGEEHRGKGLAKALLDKVKENYSTRVKGITLSCRKDYIDASRFWEKYGFKAMQTKRSRSKQENYLVKWWYDFNIADLFSSTLYETDKVNALLDCNIIVKLRDEPCLQNTEALSLIADWLEEEVEYFYAPEIFNEINRDENQKRAAESRKFLHGYKQAAFDRHEKELIYTWLEQFLTGTSSNDISDKKQLAECIASGIEYFITLDKNLLDLSDEVYAKYSVRIIRPSDFILVIDHNIKGRDYNPLRVAGAEFEYSNIRKEELETLVGLQWLGKGEKKHELRSKLNAVIADIKNAEVKLVKDRTQNCVAFFAAIITCDGFCVKVIRVAKVKAATILFQQLIKDIIGLALKSNCAVLKIEEQFLTIDRIGILETFGFELKNEIWYKVNINEIGESINILRSDQAIQNLWNVNELIHVINGLSGDAQNFFKIKLEKKLWPVKFTDIKIPVYIVPVKPHWAAQLFDHYAANHSLFGAKAELTWSNENVYYRSIKPVSEFAPARILWYVSSESKTVTGRGRCIVATSYLEEVHIGPAKTLYQKFKNFGIYEWKDINELSKNEAYNDIKALKFTDTEVFKKPVSLAQINKIFGTHGKAANTFASPVEVSTEIFNDIYRIGKQ